MNVQDISGIVAAADKAAGEAAGRYFREVMGGKDGDCCGFAWVEVSGARGNVAKALLEAGFRRETSYGGLRVLVKNFAHNEPTQGLSCLDAAQEAAAKVLQEAGFAVGCRTMLD